MVTNTVHGDLEILDLKKERGKNTLLCTCIDLLSSGESTVTETVKSNLPPTRWF